MSQKNERGFWIGEKGRTKWAETGPEMQVKAVLEQIQQKLGFTFKHGTEAFPLSIVCGDYTFHPDFIVTMPKSLMFKIEAGEHVRTITNEGKTFQPKVSVGPAIPSMDPTRLLSTRRLRNEEGTSSIDNEALGGDSGTLTTPTPRLSTNGQFEKVIEVDGIYHFTDWQRKKGRWRDSLILSQGYDIIHVDARLCQKTYLPHLKAELVKALTQGSPVEFIDG